MKEDPNLILINLFTCDYSILYLTKKRLVFLHTKRYYTNELKLYWIASSFIIVRAFNAAGKPM
jgi:hypothetical protein